VQISTDRKMDDNNDTKRLSRLTAILIILQTKRLLTNSELANKFSDNWLLIAFCSLRKDFRAFRLDGIQNLATLNEQFEPHKITLQEYFEI